ncbi:MAG: PSD1 domain-containing protein [Planctomycetales bacterium]|nr:PSD1 domain-containing protein [Planctomycetales bacterium]
MFPPISDGGEYSSVVQPLLARRCYSCHGPDSAEGGIRFDQPESLLANADSGLAAIVPGRPSESEIIKRLSSEDDSERMPPEGKPLSEQEIQAIARWVSSGAQFETHWSFKPLTRPAIPAVHEPAWCAQPIDNFILEKLEAAELHPTSAAEAASLVRRVYLDVVGLPPKPEDVEDLTRNWSAATYEKLVDRLLSDPALGDRWARMWLDIVRYAESNSFERDNPKPNVWKYRDYVINSFNQDKPYDQFLREQIAGDELDCVTEESLTATGYYRLGIWDDEPADPELALFDEYDDIVTTTGQAMLGLTINCARCHDHKIDPLTQRDYYQLVAFMRDVPSYGVRNDQVSNNQLDLDPELGEKYSLIEGEQKKIDRRLKDIEQDAIKKMAGTDQRATEGVERERVLRRRLQQFVSEEVWQEYSDLKAQRQVLNDEIAGLPPRRVVLGLGALEPRPDQTHILVRGSPHSPSESVEPGFPKLLGGGNPTILDADENAQSAGRRRLLAQWLASEENWLTARVIVNRVWQQYFGRGIVRSPNNFGLMGDPPTHPELIDYLASELIRHQWQLKPIHRMILLSSTYRMGSQSNAGGFQQDPANQLFWRQNLKRMSSEQLRDSILTVTGELNEEQFGPSMYPTLGQEVLASQSRPGNGWGNSSPAQQAKRSIYIHVKRSLPVPLMSVFDFPETDTSCEARFLTIQPGQALTLLNSDWMQEQASYLLERATRDVGGDILAQARRVLELVQGRSPVESEIEQLTNLVDRLKLRHQMNDKAARQAMCLVALNLNSFIYVE